MTVTWRIGGDGANTPITVDGRLNGYTTPTRGEQLEYEFYVQGSDALSRYNALTEYGDYPNQVAVTGAIGGRQYFRETLPSTHTKSTHVVPIVPDAGVDAVGVWGAIQDVTATVAANPGAYAELAVSVVVIAQYDRYADRTAIGAALERT